MNSRHRRVWRGPARPVGFFAALVLVATSITVSPLIAAERPGSDWPRFLGPTADNISPETGLLEKWPTNGLPLLWEKAVGTGYSAPSVRGGLLVLHHRISAEEVIESFEAGTGQRVWRHAYPSAFVDPYGYNNGPRCTPLLTEEHCYTFGAEGKLICLDRKTGRMVWERDTSRDWSVPDAFFGVGSTPILEGNKLIVMIGGQPNSGIVALDPATGKTLWENVGRTNWQGVMTTGWRREEPYQWSGLEKSASYASPVAATIHGQRHVLAVMRQGLVSVNPTNGEVNFSHWFQSLANDSVNAMCPIVKDDLILISAAYYRIGAELLRVRPDGKSVEQVWRLPAQIPNSLPAIRATPPQPLEIHWNTPVFVDGFLYAFSGRDEPDAQFNCVEFKTGKLMWSRDEHWQKHPPHGTQFPVYGRGSAIFADGKLIALGEGGKLGLFKVNPQRAEVISSFQVPQLGYPCWSAPVLSHKRLYLRSENRLLCYNLSR